MGSVLLIIDRPALLCSFILNKTPFDEAKYVPLFFFLLITSAMIPVWAIKGVTSPVDRSIFFIKLSEPKVKTVFELFGRIPFI